jgi:hypothetical protein
MGRPFAVAASASVELAVVGPQRRLSVVAATPQALYASVDDDAGTVICVASADAVRVPCALVLEPRSRPVQAPAGAEGTVGAGMVSIIGTTYRVTRWWRPPRPRGLGTVPPSQLAGAVRWLTAQVAAPLDPAGRDAVAELVGALAGGTAPASAVAHLLGRGPGLTPTGDDVLAGALVGLIALGSPVATTLADTVAQAASDATTTVSAALLRHAARGECVPQLANLLDTVARGADPATGALPRAAGALLAVGHCSGAGLLYGVLVALAIAHPRLAAEATSAGERRPAAVR